jgi:hypothetical protein
MLAFNLFEIGLRRHDFDRLEKAHCALQGILAYRPWSLSEEDMVFGQGFASLTKKGPSHVAGGNLDAGWVILLAYMFDAIRSFILLSAWIMNLVASDTNAGIAAGNSSVNDV